MKIIFLISQPKHILWVLKRTISYTQMNHLNEHQKHKIKLMGKKTITILHLKIL